MLKFHQKRLATNAWFAFNDDELSYRIRDNSGEVEFSVPYGQIPVAKRRVFERNTWLRNVGLIWCVIGIVQIGLAFGDMRAFSGSAFWLVIGVGCLGFYRATWSAYTVFDTQNGSIFIIDDQQSDDIIAVLHERRSAQLLAWYKETDYGDDDQARLNAIEWLKTQKAISEDEANKMIAAIKNRTLLPGHDGACDDTTIH